MANAPQPAPAALVEAAMRLLAERTPGSVTGRELADAAGVNYGLVHHYFGGKDSVFREALYRLRDEFMARHPRPEELPLLVDGDDPYLRALARSQVDYPHEIGRGDEFPIGEAMLRGLTRRLEARDTATGAPTEVEAKARAIAMISLQLAYGVFRAMLLDAASVGQRERPAVEHTLGRLYDELALRSEEEP